MTRDAVPWANADVAGFVVSVGAVLAVAEQIPSLIDPFPRHIRPFLCRLFPLLFPFLPHIRPFLGRIRPFGGLVGALIGLVGGLVGALIGLVGGLVSALIGLVGGFLRAVGALACALGPPPHLRGPFMSQSPLILVGPLLRPFSGFLGKLSSLLRPARRLFGLVS